MTITWRARTWRARKTSPPASIPNAQARLRQLKHEITKVKAQFADEKRILNYPTAAAAASGY